MLNYDEWRNFLKVIDKAKTACLNSGQNVSDHFVDINKMVKLGSGSEVKNWRENLPSNKRTLITKAEPLDTTENKSQNNQ